MTQKKEPATSRTGLLRVALVGACALLASACASGGGPGVSGPEAWALYARYGGTWSLDTENSDDPREMFRGRGGRPGAGRARGAGGGRGGLPGAGRGRGGVSGVPGVDVDPAGLRVLMARALSRPERLVLELTDSTFTYSATPGSRLVLPTNGDKVRLDEDPTYDANISWDDGIPTLVHGIARAGTIKDRIEVVSDGRMVVTRRLSTPGRTTDLRFVYIRVGEGPGGS